RRSAPSCRALRARGPCCATPGSRPAKRTHEMNCEQATVLLHAFIDDELDAGHAHQIEAHVAGCVRCAAELRRHREVHQLLSSAELRYEAPAALRLRIERRLAVSRPI